MNKEQEKTGHVVTENNVSNSNLNSGSDGNSLEVGKEKENGLNKESLPCSRKDGVSISKSEEDIAFNMAKEVSGLNEDNTLGINKTENTCANNGRDYNEFSLKKEEDIAYVEEGKDIYVRKENAPGSAKDKGAGINKENSALTIVGVSQQLCFKS
jgi:hypothetical protein